MLAKPVKRGIKVWCKADSHNGYISEFQVYTGRSEEAEVGLSKRVMGHNGPITQSGGKELPPVF